MLTDSSGPLLRRGTMNVFAGIAAARGHHRRPRPAGRACAALTRNVSSIATTGSSRPWYTVDSPLGDAGSGRICSTYVSVTSMVCVRRAVRDVPVLPEDDERAAREAVALRGRTRRPRVRSGTPIAGASSGRCGSLARIGRPFAVCRPPMTHEFEPRSTSRFSAWAISGACSAFFR